MKERFNIGRLAPAGLKAMLNLEAYLAHSSIEKPLRELVKLRVS